MGLPQAQASISKVIRATIEVFIGGFIAQARTVKACIVKVTDKKKGYLKVANFNGKFRKKEDSSHGPD